VNEMGAMLERLVRTPLAEEGEVPMPEALAVETRIAMEDNALQSGVLRFGQPSLYSCPECHGVLMQIKEGNIVRFRCHTGHAYSPGAMLAEVDEGIGLGLWNAVRTMSEKALLLRQMAEQEDANQTSEWAQRLLEKADEVERRAEVVRQVALS
nr:hypothetical protein [Caldilineaceae bacterium]